LKSEFSSLEVPDFRAVFASTPRRDCPACPCKSGRLRRDSAIASYSNVFTFLPFVFILPDLSCPCPPYRINVGRMPSSLEKRPSTPAARLSNRGPDPRRARRNPAEGPTGVNGFHIFARDLIQRAVLQAAIIPIKRDQFCGSLSACSIREVVAVLAPRQPHTAPSKSQAPQKYHLWSWHLIC